MLLSVQHPVTIYTDHQGLEFFRQPQALSYRHVRWYQKLSQFPMQLKYIAKDHNRITDALSRSGAIEEEDLQNEKTPSERHVS